MKDKIMIAAVTVGLLMIAVGMCMPIITKDIHCDTFRYIYAAGAALLLIGRIFCPYEGKNVRLKRLYRIETWSAIFFCAGAFFLFYDKGNLRDPLAFTLAGGIIQAFTGIMIPIIAKKER